MPGNGWLLLVVLEDGESAGERRPGLCPEPVGKSDVVLFPSLSSHRPQWHGRRWEILPHDQRLYNGLSAQLCGL